MKLFSQLTAALFAAGVFGSAIAQGVPDASSSPPVLGVLSKATSQVTPITPVATPKAEVKTNIVVATPLTTQAAQASTQAVPQAPVQTPAQVVAQVPVPAAPAREESGSTLREVSQPKYSDDTARRTASPAVVVQEKPAVVQAAKPVIRTSPAPVATPAKATVPVATTTSVATKQAVVSTQPVKAAANDEAPIKLKPLAPVTSVREEITLPPPPPTPVEAENLPGVGYMPGGSPELSNKVVKSGNERNELSYISATFVNRIATPFQDPRVIDQSGADIKVDGSDVYIKPTGPTPIAIYIVDDITHQTISMTLVPKNLPGQTIVAELQTQRPGGDDKATVPLPEEYISKLTALNIQVAQNRLPSGFTEARLPAATSRVDNLLVRPLTRYAGAYYDIYKYEITSGYRDLVEIKEESFYNDEHIRTISFYPASVLEPGQKTFMFILADKPKSEINSGLRF